MNNREIVDEFCRILLESPEMTIQAVQLRLSMTDFELRLLRADPCKEFHEEKVFPVATGQRHLQFDEANCY